jgi:hypothetical protein
VFHRFRQAKFAYGYAYDFKLEPIVATALAATKITLDIKVVKIDSNIIILLPWSKSVKQAIER